MKKQQIVEEFHDHVSSGKVDFFQKYCMDFIMGERKGSIIKDIDGKKQLFNLHCNGGVFNLGHRNPEIIDILQTMFV